MGTSTRLDDRVFAMCQLKYQPLAYSMLMIHPAFYRIDDLSDEVRVRVKIFCSVCMSQLMDVAVETVVTLGSFLKLDVSEEEEETLLIYVGFFCLFCHLSGDLFFFSSFRHP